MSDLLIGAAFAILSTMVTVALCWATRSAYHDDQKGWAAFFAALALAVVLFTAGIALDFAS